MTSPTDAHLERLVRALAGLPDDHARRLVDEAWERAEAAVRDTLVTGMQAVLLRQIIAILEEDRGTAPADLLPRDRGTAPGTVPPREPAPHDLAPSPPAVEDAEQPPARRTTDDGALVWYVYAVTAPAAEALAADVRPMTTGHDLQIVSAAGLSALASQVPAAEFGPRALQEQLSDREWLEEHVRRHDEALRALADEVALVPMRFCTVVRSTEDLERFLADHGGTLRDALDAVSGRREWGVKVASVRERLHERVRSANAEIRALDGRIASQSGGTAYFLEKRRDQLLDDEAENLALDTVSRWHARLQALAAGSELLPLQRHAEEQGGKASRLVLNGAYLVATDAEPALREAIDAFAAEGEELGLSPDLTGPWPPYSFVHLDLATDLAR